MPVGDTGGIQRAAHDVVPDSGKVSYSSAANQYDAVLLQVVADTRDVCSYFDSICKAHTSDFAKR